MPRLTAKLSLAIALVVAGLAASLFIAANAGQRNGKFKNVFVNTTSDHRFDDSIRVSILAARKRTGVQNAVVIANRMPIGKSLEQWASELFAELALGRENAGRAILYLYVPTERALKIEVSYALEGIVTDLDVKRLEEAAKTFVYVDRQHDFWAELINTINIHVQRKAEGKIGFDFTHSTYVSGGAGAASWDYDVTVEQLSRELRLLAPDRESEFRAGSTPAETLRKYLESLGQGIGDPKLPLLSSGSRLFRNHTPLTRAQLLRNATIYTEAGEPVWIEQGARALAVFARSHPVLPIVLSRTRDGRWLVDEPASWAWFHRFEDSLEVFQKFKGHPFASRMREAGFRSPDYFIYHGAAPVRSFVESDEDFTATMIDLQLQAARASSADAHFALGDFLLFEVYVPEAALGAYLKGLELDPGRHDYRWRLLDLYINLGRVRDFLETGRRLVTAHPNDTTLARDFEFFEKAYSFDPAEWQ